jgi:hypothetical protein
MRNVRSFLVVWLVCVASWSVSPVSGFGAPACRAVQQGKRLELCSPFFVFRLDTVAGLRAESWENRLTGRKISLGGGPELEFDIGLPDGSLQDTQLEVSGVEVKGQGQAGEVFFHLAAKGLAASALVTYRWDTKQPVLHKFVEIVNQGNREWNRLLNVRLGDYHTAAKSSGAGWQGFPLYLDEEFFLSLAHPAGWSVAENGRVQLRQYPGVKLAPGKKFECMEAVWGVGKAGEARKNFVDHVRSRMRRAARGHDRPYAIFEPFGARPDGNFDETEEFLLDNIAKLSEGQRQSDCHFDLYSIDFWVDFHGDLKKCDPQRFPHGLSKINRELKKLGTAPGLWIDSGGLPSWTVGGNPAVKECFSEAESKGGLCRATEPIKSMYTEAFRYHIRENGVRLLKFDNLLTTCNNPKHNHLPGLYSTEAIHNALIEFLHALDEQCPDVFLMLYWGYRSPWWLLHADTYFDSGIGIEAASPTDFPAPFVRDSITQKLDQAQWRANEDVPPLGKDSLGVWLSDWSWNSQVGKERWQGGFVMDVCRGSLLAQPWSDTSWLSPLERKQMAEFIALLKAQPGCFGNSRFILGDPRKNEPYGYCCTDGKRAFLALHNGCWKDALLKLELNSAWGLPDGQPWDLYRWYPDAARLQGEAGAVGKTVSIALRPFQIVLLEVVPQGQAPSLTRSFPAKPLPVAFSQSSRAVELSVVEKTPEPEPETNSPWTILEPASAVSAGGASLRVQRDGSILAGGKNPAPDTYTITADTALSGLTAIRLEALPDPSLPQHGPGRAPNGNFALDELRVKAWPRGNPAAGVPAVLQKPVASFSQESFGGWPIAAALDGDPKTGWSIDPFESQRHVAIFHAQQPLGFAGGTTLQFTLEQGTPHDHNLGRLRLSATTATSPLALPRPAEPRSLVIQGQVPSSHDGGLLVVSVEMKQGPAPMPMGGPGKSFSAHGKLAGKTIQCQPVLGTATYPSSWQAWRIAVQPSAGPQAFELSITTTLPPTIRGTCQGHFLPK